MSDLRRIVLCLGILFIHACTPAEQTDRPLTPNLPLPTLLLPETPSAAAPTLGPVTQVSGPPPRTHWAYTHHRADGNRLAAGQGAIDQHPPVAIQLAASPSWLLGFPSATGTVWVAWLASGEAVIFEVTEGEISLLPGSPLNLLPGQPPLAFLRDAEPRPQTFLLPFVSPFTHAVPIEGSEFHLGIDSGGALIAQSTTGIPDQAYSIGALPDARPVVNSQGQAAILSGATDRYPHAVLGDDLEAATCTIFSSLDGEPVVDSFILPEGLVAEGTAPIWTDANQDGQMELLVTLSDRAAGARLALVTQKGSLLAASDPIGSGFRWRHQIAIGPVGAGEAIEIVSVHTPHIGGIAQFHRLNGSRLELVAALPGYSSHESGSRNLDMAIVGDFNGNGLPELAVTDQSRTALAGIERMEGGAQEIWRFPLGDELTTNLAAVTDAAGGLWLAAGTASGQIWIWSP